MSEEDQTPSSPTVNITANGYLVPTAFLWSVVAPCTMAVCRFTIAPELTWWDVTMPLWGLPAVLVGVLVSGVVVLAGVLVLAVSLVAVVALPVFAWLGLVSLCSSVSGWVESRLNARAEARIILNQKEISEGIVNRIKQSFASIGACDCAMSVQSMDLGVKALISSQLIGGSKFTLGVSWSLLEAEGKPASFFRGHLTDVVSAVRKRIGEEDKKNVENRRSSATSH